ncbi:Uma2 family endonuclease [Streptomyces sp. DSM 44915]|uniref:Uma2 family endonuclease n=1 Tax=Streptomyces chisholmiae TaxID=3075540 RepID=A0ABU2JRL0_9ACTN|nr:Uma2 family endonuclease [Streptomyces sp. DSM 44915]MDT0267616.1 Uma2 family endonuclease [Streptomyces sp. DSM 44915]
MSVEPNSTYQWPRPPQDGYTSDDLDQLPNLPPHTELIDGSLVFVTPQTVFHSEVVDLLKQRLRQAAPSEYRVYREMTVTIDGKNRPEPDVLVTRADAYANPEQTTFRPEDVVLAVEVVSAESRARDRESKPFKYAAAGITHFWRVERQQGRPVVYVYELDPTGGSYVPTGIYHDQLKVPVPFPVDIDLNEID